MPILTGDNEVRMVSDTGAEKGSKMARFDLIPPGPLRELATHYGVGSLKYEDRNWEKGYDWSLSFAALMRHAWQFWDGEDLDDETKSKHVIAVAWHALALAEFMETHREFDTRPQPPRTPGGGVAIERPPILISEFPKIVTDLRARSLDSEPDREPLRHAV